MHTTPAGPYEVHEVEATGNRGRVDTAGCELGDAVDEDDTSLNASTTPARTPWRTTANGAQTPFDIAVGGERMTVTAIANRVSDAFGRTVVDGWGSADSGQAYVLSDTAAQYDVNGGVGRIAPSGLGSDRFAHIDVGEPVQDAKVVVDIDTAITGGSIRHGLLLRLTDGSNHYRFVIAVTTANAVTAEIARREGGSLTSLTSLSLPAIGYSNINIRAYAGPAGELKMKVWNSGSDEPRFWLLETTDTNLDTGNGVALFARKESGSALPSELLFDDFAVYNPQTLTVTRSINGVVKSHAAGAPLSLWRPGRTAL